MPEHDAALELEGLVPWVVEIEDVGDVRTDQIEDGLVSMLAAEKDQRT